MASGLYNHLNLSAQPPVHCTALNCTGPFFALYRTCTLYSAVQCSAVHLGLSGQVEVAIQSRSHDLPVKIEKTGLAHQVCPQQASTFFLKRTLNRANSRPGETYPYANIVLCKFCIYHICINKYYCIIMIQNTFMMFNDH